MNIDLQTAVTTRLNFELLYSDGGVRPLSDQAERKLGQMIAGCVHRRALAALAPGEALQRKMRIDFIALEPPNLWTLFEA